MKLNGIHQLLACADDVNLVGYNIDTMKKIRGTSIDTGSEVGLEVNTEKTKYMLLSRHQDAGQNRDIKTDNRYIENVAQFRCLATTITNQTLIQEEIKRRLKSGNACYHSVQDILTSRLLPKNVNLQKKYDFACGSVWV
jgi:ribosomal protein S16